MWVYKGSRKLGFWKDKIDKIDKLYKTNWYVELIINVNPLIYVFFLE